MVELEVTTKSTRALIDGAGRTWSTNLWTYAPIRKQRYTVDVPAGRPLVVEAVGVPVPAVQNAGSRQRVSLEVGALSYSPLQETLAQRRVRLPRFGWSTSPSWGDVATRYQRVIQPVLDEKAALPGLKVAPTATTRQKVEAVLRAVSDNLRYTAVHLGDGAIVPTRPSAVLKRGYGDCKDLAVLVAAALRELNVESSVALTMAEGEAPRDGLPGLEAFNHMIVVVQDQSTLLWVDATAPGYPVGVLPPGDRDQKALIIAPSTTGLVATPTADQTPAAFKTVYDLRFGSFADGAATVTSSAQGAFEGQFRCGAAALRRGRGPTPYQWRRLHRL